MRNFHQGSRRLFDGLFHAGLQQLSGGRGIYKRYQSRLGHTRMRHIFEVDPDGGARSRILGRAMGGGGPNYDGM